MAPIKSTFLPFQFRMAASEPNHTAVVRLADLKDALQITAVINASFREVEEFFVAGDRIDLAEVRELFSKGKFLLAETDGKVVGCVYIEPRGERAYLGLLAVDPEIQQSGVGSALMNAAEEYCSGLGCRYMDIKIVNLRESLPAFYHKRGYIKTGESPFPEEIETILPCHFIDMSKQLI
jgi:N-acetylglutamate synthase-like GNAT family acetyltransferase